MGGKKELDIEKERGQVTAVPGIDIEAIKAQIGQLSAEIETKKAVEDRADTIRKAEQESGGALADLKFTPFRPNEVPAEKPEEKSAAMEPAAEVAAGLASKVMEKLNRVPEAVPENTSVQMSIAGLRNLFGKNRKGLVLGGIFREEDGERYRAQINNETGDGVYSILGEDENGKVVFDPARSLYTRWGIDEIRAGLMRVPEEIRGKMSVFLGVAPFTPEEQKEWEIAEKERIFEVPRGTTRLIDEGMGFDGIGIKNLGIDEFAVAGIGIKNKAVQMIGLTVFDGGLLDIYDESRRVRDELVSELIYQSKEKAFDEIAFLFVKTGISHTGRMPVEEGELILKDMIEDTMNSSPVKFKGIDETVVGYLNPSVVAVKLNDPEMRAYTSVPGSCFVKEDPEVTKANAQKLAQQREAVKKQSAQNPPQTLWARLTGRGK